MSRGILSCVLALVRTTSTPHESRWTGRITSFTGAIRKATISACVRFAMPEVSR